MIKMLPDGSFDCYRDSWSCHPNDSTRKFGELFLDSYRDKLRYPSPLSRGFAISVGFIIVLSHSVLSVKISLHKVNCSESLRFSKLAVVTTTSRGWALPISFYGSKYWSKNKKGFQCSESPKDLERWKAVTNKTNLDEIKMFCLP